MGDVISIIDLDLKSSLNHRFPLTRYNSYHRATMKLGACWNTPCVTSREDSHVSMIYLGIRPSGCKTFPNMQVSLRTEVRQDENHRFVD
jgi:hypothetical protein